MGLVCFCLPVTVLLCFVVRGPVAPVAFAQLPDTPLRLHDYRALSLRRPPLALTAISALIGAVSHALWDTFTHDGRWGARHVAILREEVATIGSTSLSVARALQYVGHVGGAIVTLALLAYIAERRLLRQWYGAAFDELPPVVLSNRSRAGVLGCRRGRLRGGIVLGAALRRRLRDPGDQVVPGCRRRRDDRFAPPGGCP